MNKYGRELSQKNQLLNGEYGAWRADRAARPWHDGSA